MSSGPAEVRAAAAWALERTLSSRAPADRFLDEASGGLEARDRRLLYELVLGTLRWLRRLDHVIEAASSRRLEQIEPALRAPLRIAAYQLLFLDHIPAHAAVGEAVRGSRRRSRRGAGFVNAVLRTIARRNRLELWPVEVSDPVRRLAVESSHPDLLVSRWIERFGETATRRLLAVNNRPKPKQLLCIGHSGGRQGVQADLAAEGVETSCSGLSPLGLVVERGDPVATGCFRRGQIYLQDTASQAAAWIPPPRSDERVLDLAAAPGGKSFALLAWQSNLRISCADVDLARLQQLRRNSRRLRLRVAELVGDGRRPPFADSFDRVVVDLPCTGTGTLRKHPELKWRFSGEELRRLSAAGGQLVDGALGSLRPSGLLVVITCSLEDEENVGLAARLRERHPELRPLPLAGQLPDSLSSAIREPGCWQLLPGDEHDGFTVSVLRRD